MTFRERVRQFLGELIGGGGPGARLARGAGTAFVIRTLGTFVVFGNQVLLARVLGAEEYGRYIYVMTWVGLLVILSQAGFGAASVKYVAEYRGKGEWALLRGFMRWAVRLSFAVSSLGALSLGLVTLAIYSRIGGELARVFWIGCLLLPFWTLLEIRSSALRGYGRILAAQGATHLLRPLLFTSGILALFFLGSETTRAVWAIGANLAATLLAFALLDLASRRTFDLGGSQRTQTRAREWTAVSMPLLLLAGFGMILNSTDTLMLGLLIGTTEAGIYAVASRAAAFVPFMLVAVNVMAAPLISEYYASGETGRMQRMLKIGAWLGFVFGALVSAAFLVLGRPILSMFGAEFVLAYAPLMILTVGYLLSTIVGSAGYALTMTGFQSIAMGIYGAVAAANILLNLLLIPEYGATGAAVASAMSVSAASLLLLISVIRKLDANPSVLPMRARN